ncbi:hypothetical protein SAMD00019534_100550, partial [Acytostelium subglobosum LB1]|uniref:hypothetical protein n=1 Tax=Acytostelium subglobosum LB1 TaxID=1410327 RepID=UPI0006449A2A
QTASTLTEQQLLQEREQSIDYYRHYLNDTLNVNLEHMLQHKQRIHDDLQTLLELRSNLELMIEGHMTELKTMLNLGCECYAKAKVPDTSKIYINIGLDISVQMTLQEAVDFTKDREQHLILYVLL